MISFFIASLGTAVGASDLADEADAAQLPVQAQRVFVGEVAAQGNGTAGEERLHGSRIAQAEEGGEGSLRAGSIRTWQEPSCEDQVVACFRCFARHRP